MGESIGQAGFGFLREIEPKTVSLRDRFLVPPFTLLHNLVGDTVMAFEAAGAHFYNDAVLMNAVGSLPIRVTKQFNSGRKMGKCHQNVLVFYKGDPKRIKTEFGGDVVMVE